MEKIKNIIFDFGNVIYAIDFTIAQKAFSELGIPDVETFFGHKAQHPIFNDLETGAITPAEFRDGIRREANNPSATDAEIDAAWNKMLLGVVPETLEVLEKVKKHYRTFLLSNTNKIHYDFFIDYLKKEHKIGNDHLFEKPYYSHEMLLRKPHVEIFEQVIRENNLNPAETLFIDDSPQHLVGAKAAGLQTLLMTEHPKDLGKFLANNGITL